MWLLRDWKLILTIDQVLRGQGAEPATVRSRRPALVEVAEWALSEGLPLIDPAVIVQEFRVEKVHHERLILEGGQLLSGPLIAQHLAGSKKIFAILCTIGGQLESVASEVLKSDMLKGLALDGLGSAAVQELTVQACSLFESQAQAEGFKTSIPLNPGMVGWPVDPAQRQVFSLVDGQAIGIRLNDSLMMSPSKSLSLVLSAGENLTDQGRTCDFCSLNETCRFQDHYSHVHS